MGKFAFIPVLLLSTTKVWAYKPEFFTDEIDREYRAVLDYLLDVLPDNGKHLAYLGLLTPYNLLEIYPTKVSDHDKQEFANFNLGVMSGALLPLDAQQSGRLGNLVLCHQSDCQQNRIDQISAFLQAMAPYATGFVDQQGFDILQQLSAQVFRINNTFITPAQAVTYLPSELAGFIPSARYTEHTNLQAIPEILILAKQSEALREVMSQYEVKAMAKTPSGAINVVFGGLGDNHWGVMIGTEDEPLPSKGQLSPLGYAYDVVESIAPNAFYYQTN